MTPIWRSNIFQASSETHRCWPQVLVRRSFLRLIPIPFGDRSKQVCLDRSIQTRSTALANGLLTTTEIRSIAGRQLVKSFPRSLRVTLPEVPQASRLKYRPLGAEITLEQILERFPSLSEHYKSLADYFEVRNGSGDLIGFSRYIDCLSDNRRDLRQLHEALESIEVADTIGAGNALAVILQHRLESTSEETPSALSEAIAIQMHSGERPSLEMDLREIGFGKLTAGASPIYKPPLHGPQPIAWSKSPILMRDIMRFRAVYQPHTLENSELEDKSSSDAQVELNRQFVSLLNLAWEIRTVCGEGSDSFLILGHFGRFGTPGTSDWTDLVGADTRNVAWVYWVTPDWEEYSDYNTYLVGWSSIHQALQSREAPVGDTYLLEYVLLCHLHLIANVQIHRRVPDEFGSVDRQIDIAPLSRLQWDEMKDGYLGRVRGLLEDALAYSRSVPSLRNLDFVAWFERFLPLAATPLLCPSSLSEWILNTWRSNVAEGDRVRAANNAAIIAERNLTNDLGEADVELLSWLDDKRAESMSNLRSVLSQDRDRRRAAILQALDESVTRECRVAVEADQ